MEARDLKLSCGQAQALQEGSRGEISPCLFWLLMVARALDVSWFIDTLLQSLALSSQNPLLSVFLCPNFLLFVGIPVMGSGSTLIQHDLTLIWQVPSAKDSISKKGHALGFHMNINFGGTLLHPVYCSGSILPHLDLSLWMYHWYLQLNTSKNKVIILLARSASSGWGPWNFCLYMFINVNYVKIMWHQSPDWVSCGSG